jgi:hypothetical protein
MKITAEHYDYTYTIETPYDDLTVDQVRGLVNDLLKAMGYDVSDEWLPGIKDVNL